MASGLGPMLWRLVRSGTVTVTTDRRQLLLCGVSALTVLYFAYTTAFVVDGDASDTVTATMTPFFLQGLYLFFPLGVWLFLLIKKSFSAHVVLGLVALVMLGSTTFGFLFFSFAPVIVAGSVTAAMLYVLTLVETFYDMWHRGARVLKNMSKALAALFLGAFIALPVDWLFGHFAQYQLVIQDARAHLPDTVSVNVEEPMTIHYFLWLTVFMVLFLQLFRVLRIRTLDETKRSPKS